ncbi:hypothetical protein ACWEQP_13130 [Streptomyces sp. NPDC004044]
MPRITLLSLDFMNSKSPLPQEHRADSAKRKTVGVAVQEGIDLGRHPETRRAPDSDPTPERPRVAAQEPQADQDTLVDQALGTDPGAADQEGGPSQAPRPDRRIPPARQRRGQESL